MIRLFVHSRWHPSFGNHQLEFQRRDSGKALCRNIYVSCFHGSLFHLHHYPQRYGSQL